MRSLTVLNASSALSLVDLRGLESCTCLASLDLSRCSALRSLAALDRILTL